MNILKNKTFFSNFFNPHLRICLLISEREGGKGKKESEREKEREREREISINVRNIDRGPLILTRLNPQPRYVP